MFRICKVLKEILAENVPNIVKDINLKIRCFEQDEPKEIHSLTHLSQKTLGVTKEKFSIGKKQSS